MAQTGSMIAFIVLVVIVVFGVMLYAFLTVVGHAKESQAAIDQFVGNGSAKYHRSTSFSEFANFVSQNQPAEWNLPLAKVNAIKDQLEAGLSASDPASGSTERVDANLVADCIHCGLRVPGSDFYTLTSEVCSTPNCGSTQVALRWLANNGAVEDLPTTGEEDEDSKVPKPDKSSY